MTKAIQKTNPHDKSSTSSKALLLADTINLILGKRLAHMLPHAYEGDGMQKWNSVATDPRFPANKETHLVADADVIERVVDEISRVKDVPTFVELGPGDPISVERKTIPLLKHFQAVTGKPIDYVAVDIVEDAAIAAAERVKSLLPEAKTRAEGMDFLKLDKKLPVTGRPSIGIMWGGTLFNAQSDPDILDRFILAGNLDKIRTLLGPDGRLITTYHYPVAGESFAKMLAPYDTTENKEFIANTLQIIKERVEPSFRPECFDIEIAFDPSKRRITAEAVVKEPHGVTFSKFDNLRHEFNKGDRLRLANSHKLNNREVERMFLDADMRVLANIPDQDNGMGLIVSSCSL